MDDIKEIFKKKKRAFLTILLGMALLFLVIVFLTTSKEDIAASAHYDGYSPVYEIPGICFYVPANVATAATAISEVSDNVGIEDSQTYVYRNGTNKYLLFNMGVLTIAVEKETEFETDVTDDSVCGIFFNKDGKSNGDNPFITPVIGEFTPTTELYGDYAGAVAIYNFEGIQYTIFAGVPNAKKYDDLSDDMKDALGTIVKSLTLSDYSRQETTSYEVEVTAPETETKTVEEKPADEIPEAVEKQGENVLLSPEKEDIESEAVLLEKTSEKDTTSLPEDVSTINESTEQEETPLQEETINNTIPNKDRDKNKAYSSDVYSMLSLGDSGIINEYNNEISNYSQVIINVSKVYREKEASALIKKYCEDFHFYNYFDAPEGCAWNAAEYYIKNGEDLPYINIKLKGIDGNQLVFRGIRYTQRTYDMLEYASSNAFCGPYYVFYAVPNGCSEYALECGSGYQEMPNSECFAAYYLVQ